jgi:hypothetical protein
MNDLVTLLRNFGETPLEGGNVDPLIDVMNSLAHRAADEIEAMRAELAALRAPVGSAELHLIARDVIADHGSCIVSRARNKCDEPDDPCICLSEARAVIAAVAPRIVAAERERCARVIEDYQETIAETSDGPTRHVIARKQGNLMGLAFAAAIRKGNAP